MSFDVLVHTAIGISCGVVALVLLVIMCFLKPWCCKKCCPGTPSNFQIKVKRRSSSRGSKKTLINEQAINAKDASFDSARGSSTEGSPIHQKTEMMPIITEATARNLTYHSFLDKRPSLSLSDEAPPRYLVTPIKRLSLPPSPPRSLQITIKYLSVENTLEVTINRLCLYRPRRKRGVVIRAELIQSARNSGILSKIPWSQGGNKCIGSYETEVRQQVPELRYGDTIYVNMCKTQDQTLKLMFSVLSTEGTTISDIVGYAEIDMLDVEEATEAVERDLLLKSASKVHKGEAQVSLCYLPTAEKLSVVILKAKDLKTNIPVNDEQEVYVKMSLIYKNAALGTRKSHHLKMKGPVLPEVFLDFTHTFDLPREHINDVTLLMTFKRSTPDVIHKNSSRKDDFTDDEHVEIDICDVTFGSILVGENVDSEVAKDHWRLMMSYPRIPTLFWELVQ